MPDLFPCILKPVPSLMQFPMLEGKEQKGRCSPPRVGTTVWGRCQKCCDPGQSWWEAMVQGIAWQPRVHHLCSP